MESEFASSKTDPNTISLMHDGKALIHGFQNNWEKAEEGDYNFYLCFALVLYILCQRCLALLT